MSERTEREYFEPDTVLVLAAQGHCLAARSNGNEALVTSGAVHSRSAHGNEAHTQNLKTDSQPRIKRLRSPVETQCTQ